MIAATLKKVLLLLVMLFAVVTGAGADSQRERLSMDFGWQFSIANASNLDYGGLSKASQFTGPVNIPANGAEWRTIDLPHDWAVELPFDQAAPDGNGCRAIGEHFPQNSGGWYMRSFDIPSTDFGRRISIEFDGVFRDSAVWLNGNLLGRNDSGYAPFNFDITDYINYGGSNVLVVSVNATHAEGWWYEGAGINRNVWLVKTGPLHVPQWGTFVTSEVNGSKSQVTARTTIANEADVATSFQVVSRIMDSSGKSIAESTSEGKASPWSNTELTQKISVGKPSLWSPETPHLYTLDTRILSKGKVVDHYTTVFGIRTIRFDPEKGLFLNGKHLWIKGMVDHLDHAGVGRALPDRLQYWRIERIKEMGCNAYRASVYPWAPETLDACDRIGLMVLSETRLIGMGHEYASQLERLIRRDRNHPSVIAWTLGNEEYNVTRAPIGVQLVKSMRRLAKQLDPTRPTTIAGLSPERTGGINEIVDVRGWNYALRPDGMDKQHKLNPSQPQMGTEQSSALGTRGIYADDPSHCFMSAYDIHGPSWGTTAEKWWKTYAARPFMSGGFVWTGFDYHGEPTPYGWPAVSSQFGVMDLCGFPKDNFYYYQSWWSDKTVLHIFPHWNWKGKEGQEIPVWCDSNCDEVELFLNDRSMGRQKMQVNSHLEWKVKYEPGILFAKGYKKGVLVATDKVETTGEPAAIRLTADRSRLFADGRDVSMIAVAVVDAQGRVVPTANNRISFSSSGGGMIIGTGNGDPASHEPESVVMAQESTPFATWKRKVVKSSVNMAETGARVDDSAWETTSSETKDAKAGETTVYRAKFDLSDFEPTPGRAELYITQTNRTSSVWINGRAIGEWQRHYGEHVFDLSTVGHPGENTIAVVVSNPHEPVQLGRFSIRRPAKTSSCWRSAFNGLCQVIVRSSKGMSNTTLTATCEGLKPATLNLRMDEIHEIATLP